MRDNKRKEISDFEQLFLIRFLLTIGVFYSLSSHILINYAVAVLWLNHESGVNIIFQGIKKCFIISFVVS